MTDQTPAKLFVPDAYVAADPVALVRTYPFAVLTTASPSGEVWATSLPIYFETDGGTDVLIGHMARRNAHATAMQPGQPALAVFSGPDAYVSPRWYQERPEVPTWNYVAAHARGPIEMIDDEDAQRTILARTITLEEQGAERPWTLDDAPEGRVAKLLPLIRSFRIRVASLEGVTKLSQTHPASDRARVADALAGSALFGASDVAKLMRQLG